jgi:hypothetical protein
MDDEGLLLIDADHRGTRAIGDAPAFFFIRMMGRLFAGIWFFRTIK